MHPGFTRAQRGSLKASCDPFGDLRTTPSFCVLVQAALPQPCLPGPSPGSLADGAESGREDQADTCSGAGGGYGTTQHPE